MIRRSFTAFAAVLFMALHAQAAPRVVESFSVGDVTYSDAATIVNVTATTDRPVHALGMTGQWEFVSGDLGGGTFPWLLDTVVDADGPNGPDAQWGPAIGGDVTIASYPVADWSGSILDASPGTGAWSFGFRNVPAMGGVARIVEATLYLMEEVPDRTFAYTAQPIEFQTWDRPFFIEGVSGLGPVNYDLLTFTVTVSGGYRFTSELSTGGDHFTFIYAGPFSPGQPLVNLLDYGLGNGNSPFDVPRGTSAFDVLLLEGVTYHWVTSTWASFSPLAPSDNTIIGPGDIISDRFPVCPGDINTTGTVNGKPDGVTDLADLQFFLNAWQTTLGNSPGSPADVNTTGETSGVPDGVVNISDLQFFLNEWQTGLTECP